MESQWKDLAGAALEALPVAVLIADPSGGILARNPAAEEMLPPGATLSLALPCAIGEDLSVDWPAELTGLHGAGPRRHSNLRLRAPGGAARLIDVHLSPLPGGGGTALVMAADVTERASMERRLATSERLAAVGKLAAQVAHELNNPLDGILRYLGLAERVGQAGQAEKLTDYLAQARVGLQRMAQIIAELLDFSRSGRWNAQSATAASLIDQAIAAMAPSLEAAGVSIVCDMVDDPRPLMPENLFQVFCNLMKNAADAMPAGGRLIITARGAGDRVNITFADSGTGIPAELLDRIFEPFFSTKTGRKGTGLGLSISRDIVERAGGTILAANRPDGGAVFTISMPCQPGEGG